MRPCAKIFTVIIFCSLLAVLCDAKLADQNCHANETDGKIVVEIDYGSARPSRIVELPSEKGKTALEVLQRIAIVETHPVGQYVFVTSIDGVKGARGEMAWYYTLDGKSPKELAYSKVLQGSERVKWIYKNDVCSRTVGDERNTSTK